MDGFVEIDCICSRCKTSFLWKDAVIKKRKLYNVEVEERTCPKCGSRGISPKRDIHFMAHMASKHTSNGRD